MISIYDQARRDHIMTVLAGLCDDINAEHHPQRPVVPQELLDRYGWCDPRTLRGWTVQGALGLLRPSPDRPGAT